MKQKPSPNEFIYKMMTLEIEKSSKSFKKMFTWTLPITAIGVIMMVLDVNLSRYPGIVTLIGFALALIAGMVLLVFLSIYVTWHLYLRKLENPKAYFKALTENPEGVFWFHVTVQDSHGVKRNAAVRFYTVDGLQHVLPIHVESRDAMAHMFLEAFPKARAGFTPENQKAYKEFKKSL